jgi:diguanylate cyclase (GGDEF)-like protein
VLRLVQDPNATMQDLTTVLSRDPALAAKILQMSNSPLFGRGGGAITSLERAAAMLGFRAVKVIALGFSLQSELPTRGECAGLDLQAFWHRSLVNAVIARLLARRTGSRLVEEAFLAGLLSMLGKLILAQSAAEAYGPLVASSGGWPDNTEEQDALGFDSSDVTAALLVAWGLPALFSESLHHATRFKEPPSATQGEVRELTAILRLSLRTASVLFDADKGAAMRQLSQDAGALYDFDAAHVAALMSQVEQGVAETAAVLDLALPPGVSYQSILDAARQQMATVSLDAAVTLRREEERAEEFRSRASTDSLTGLANRAAFDEFLSQQAHARVRGGLTKALGVVIIDIDLFKRVNDTWGHPAGDAVLRTVGLVLASATRTNELAARYGGEEFALIAPAADPDELGIACERIRQAIAAAETVLPHGERIRITASLGAACLRSMSAPAEVVGLLERADQMLYAAKRGGRDRVQVDPRQES